MIHTNAWLHRRLNLPRSYTQYTNRSNNTHCSQNYSNFLKLQFDIFFPQLFVWDNNLSESESIVNDSKFHRMAQWHHWFHQKLNLCMKLQREWKKNDWKQISTNGFLSSTNAPIQLRKCKNLKAVSKQSPKRIYDWAIFARICWYGKSIFVARILHRWHQDSLPRILGTQQSTQRESYAVVGREIRQKDFTEFSWHLVLHAKYRLLAPTRGYLALKAMRL